MRDADEALEKVLAGLREVAAPEGMDRRVLERLEREAVDGRRPGWRWAMPVFARLPGGVRVAAGVAAVGVLGALMGVFGVHRAHGPEVARPVAAERMEAGSRNQEASVPAPRLSPARGGLRRVSLRERRRGAPVREEDVLALREMRAPSLLAPPEPLTEQERLLVKLAHKGDPEELAMLSPEVRARRDAAGRAEVKRFFEPRTTGGTE